MSATTPPGGSTATGWHRPGAPPNKILATPKSASSSPYYQVRIAIVAATVGSHIKSCSCFPDNSSDDHGGSGDVYGRCNGVGNRADEYAWNGNEGYKS